MFCCRKLLSLVFIICCSYTYSQNFICPENTNIDDFLNQAVKLNNQNDYKKAIDVLHSAIAISDSVGCDKGKSLGIKNLMLLYQQVSDFQNAIKYGEKMLQLAKEDHNAYNRRMSYMVLAKSYLATNNNEESQKYLNLYTKINDSIVEAEKLALSIPNSDIKVSNGTNSGKNISEIIITSVSALLLAVVILFVYRRKGSSSKNSNIDGAQSKDEEYESHGDLHSTDFYHNTEKNNSIISDETLATIIKKIKKFENSDKFRRKDINLTWLSNHLNTNTKYLSEAIKLHSNKNFNSYINGLRIAYIIQKLNEDPVYREYKISYLSEVCGYASPQVFVIAFKKETGVTPSYFIENLEQ